MKRLYKTVLEHASQMLGELPGEKRSPATKEAIRAAETKLGVPLPKTFKQFAEQVGSASWPVDIYSLEALAPYPREWERPPYLLAFATDGGGNDWCFDTRKLQQHEYPIVFWDHEEPPHVEEFEEQGSPTPFDEWLTGLVSDKLGDNESGALAERRRNIEAALERYRETNTWPWAPGEEDIATVEASIGFALPRDYVWFTTKFGSTAWPLVIPDALELGRLTDEMRQRFPATKEAWVAFARETDGTFVAFQKSGRPLAVGGQPVEDLSFLDFLERRIQEGSKARPKSDLVVQGARANEEDVRASASATFEDVPYRIVEDDHTNSVWRAVANAKQFTATTSPDGRIQVQVEDFIGGRRRMFISADAWETVKQHLAKRAK